jgi:serine/threonine protein kinase
LVNDRGEACIADLGLAQKYDIAGVATVPTEGPARWKAPELITYQLRGGRVPQIPAAADIWAFGMTGLEVRSSLTRTFWVSLTISELCQILEGKYPFYRIVDEYAVATAILNGRFPERKEYPKVSDGMWRVLEQCWIQDPIQRPSMEYLYERLTGDLPSTSRL